MVTQYWKRFKGEASILYIILLAIKSNTIDPLNDARALNVYCTLYSTVEKANQYIQYINFLYL